MMFFEDRTIQASSSDQFLKQTLTHGLSPVQLADNSSRKDQVIVVSSILIAIISITIFLRLYARLAIKRITGIDDLFMTIAVFFAISSNIAAVVCTNWGSGTHVWKLPLEGLSTLLPKFVKIQHVLICFEAVSITFAKWSIISTYLYYFPGKLLQITCLTIAIITIAQMIIMILLVVFECIPVQAAWDKSQGSGKCIHIAVFVYLAAGLNIVTDILLVVIPLPLIKKLNLPRMQAFIIGGVFFLGTFTCVAGILRIVAINNATIVDWFYATVPYVRWALVECATIIVCGSIPAMYPLVSTWLPSRAICARRRSESSGGSYPEGNLKTKTTESSHHSNKNFHTAALRPPPISRGLSGSDIAEWETLLRESQARANQIMTNYTPYSEV